MDTAKQPVTEAVQTDQAREHWDQIVEQVAKGKKRVLLADGDKQLVVVVPARDLARLLELDAQDADDVRILEASRAAFTDIPDEELVREVDRAFREARERLRSGGSEQRGMSGR